MNQTQHQKIKSMNQNT